MRALPALAVALAIACSPAEAPPAETPEENPAAEAPAPAQDDPIADAVSALPEALQAGATVMDWENNVLREGTNGWTCMPNRPSTPGPDPMCFDEVAMAWAAAWMAAETPQISGVGLSYMLMGGADASNSDPFATEPPEGSDWLVAGPHVMIFVPDPATLDAMTDDPASGGPWVMFKGTPYAHVMMPIQ